MRPVPVVVVSSDPLARAGLATLVSAADGLVLAGQDASIDRDGAVRPAGAVLLLDVGVGGASPPGPAQAIAAGAPVVAVAFDASGAADALRAGARAVLLRGASPEAVAAAVAGASVGLTVLDAALAGAFVRPPEREGVEPLTPREHEVLALLAEGLSNKAIASHLDISEHTAKFHVNSILGKLGASTRAEAIVRAARMGLVVL